MEVLRATEILEKEINENAQKKAECILAEAKKECKQIADEADKRVADVEKQENEVLEKRLGALKMRVDAAVPLEKGRFLASYVDDTFMAAVTEYIKALDEKKQLQLIVKAMEKYKPVITSKKFIAYGIGFDCKAVQDSLVKVLGADLIVSCKPMEIKEAVNIGILSANSSSLQKGIVLECEDGSVRCCVTFEDIVSNLKEINGEDLIKALFCGGLPQ